MPEFKEGTLELERHGMSQFQNKGKGSPKPFQKPCSAQQLLILLLLMRGNSWLRSKSCRGVLAVRNLAEQIPPSAKQIMWCS